MASPRILTIPLACTVFLAVSGCSSGNDDGSEATGGPSTSDGSSAPAYTLSVTNFPTVAIQRNSAFQYALNISGDTFADSDHIGGHFGLNAVSNPTVPAYANGCNHVPGSVPGQYSVSCTTPNQAGTYYLRAHFRLGADPDFQHFWSSEYTFTVS